MVTQAQLNDGLEKLRCDLTTVINESIQSVKDTLINLNDDDKKNLGLATSTEKIYLNEHLSPYNTKLAFYCRRLKKTGSLTECQQKRGY